MESTCVGDTQSTGGVPVNDEERPRSLSGCSYAGCIANGDYGANCGANDDIEADGALLGAEDLPMVSATGVLVLPWRPNRRTSNKSGGAQNEVVATDLDDVVLKMLGDGDLAGWGPDCDREDWRSDRLFDAAQTAKHFAEYVANEAGGRTAATSSSTPQRQWDVEQVKALAPDVQPAKPAQGPGLLELARDPRRREECPVCAAEWSRALEQLNPNAPVPPKGGEVDRGPMRRYTTGKRGKMHSLRCNWLWFQQNLCTSLCALRFDAQGAPRPLPPSPSTVLPPAMPDVWHYWKQKGGRGDRERVAATTDRMTRGEPAV